MNTEITLNEAGSRFVESLGLLAEAEGMARIMGRIFGLLIISESALSLDSIASMLGVSKASVSTDARKLESVGFLERVSHPGDRRDFYCLAPDFIARSMRNHVKRMGSIRTTLCDAKRELNASGVVLERITTFESVLLRGMHQLEETIGLLEDGKHTFEAEVPSR